MAKSGMKKVIYLIVLIVILSIIIGTIFIINKNRPNQTIAKQTIQEINPISYTYTKQYNEKQSEVYVLIKEEKQIEKVEEIPVRPSEEAVDQTEVKVEEKENETPKIQENSNQEPEMTYINGILLVNKTHELPSTYNPGANQEALDAFNNMKKEASKDGISLKIVSGYRSYETQAAIFKKNVNLYGEEKANTFSARPGQSEHQTGLAFDINSTKWAFADTAEAKWLAENCHRFGFIIRYPEGKEDITGYVYEPWHIRYLNVEVATEIKNLGVCLEEYLGAV